MLRNLSSFQHQFTVFILLIRQTICTALNETFLQSYDYSVNNYYRQGQYNTCLPENFIEFSCHGCSFAYNTNGFKV